MSKRSYSVITKLSRENCHGILNNERERQESQDQQYSTATTQPVSRHVLTPFTRDPHRWNRSLSLDRRNQVRQRQPIQNICSVCQCKTKNRYTCPKCGCPLTSDECSSAPKRPSLDVSVSNTDDHHHQQQQQQTLTPSYRVCPTRISEQTIQIPVLQVRIGLQKFSTKSTVMIRNNGIRLEILDGHETVLMIRLTDIRKCFLNSRYPVIFVFPRRSCMYKIRQMLHLNVSDFSANSSVKLKQCVSIFPAFAVDEQPNAQATMDSINTLVRRYVQNTCIVKELTSDEVIDVLFDRSFKSLGSTSDYPVVVTSRGAFLTSVTAPETSVPAPETPAAAAGSEKPFTQTMAGAPPSLPLGSSSARGTLLLESQQCDSGESRSGVRSCKKEPAGQSVEDESFRLKRRRSDQSVVPDGVKRRRSVNRQPRDLGRLGELEALPHDTMKQEESAASHSSLTSRVTSSSTTDCELKFVQQQQKTEPIVLEETLSMAQPQFHEQQLAETELPQVEDEEQMEPNKPLLPTRMDELDIHVVLMSNGSRRTLNFGPMKESVRLACNRVRVGSLIAKNLADVRIRSGLNAGIFFTLTNERCGTQSIGISADEIVSCELCVSRCGGVSVIFLTPNDAGTRRLCAKLNVSTSTGEPAFDPTGSAVRCREIVLFIDHISHEQEDALTRMERPVFGKLDEIRCLIKLAHIKLDSVDPKAARRYLVTNRLTGLSGYEKLVDIIATPETLPGTGNGTAANSEVIVTETEVGIRCQYTQQIMKWPLQNLICRHNYEREAIITYIQHKAENARCPFVGCGNTAPLKLEQLVENDVLRAYIQLKNPAHSS